MMKKKKLDLAQIQVKSFITNLDANDEQTVKGGSHVTGCGFCDTADDYFCQTIPGQCIKTNDKNCQSEYKLCASNYKSCGIVCPIPYEPAKY